MLLFLGILHLELFTKHSPHLELFTKHPGFRLVCARSLGTRWGLSNSQALARCWALPKCTAVLKHKYGLSASLCEGYVATQLSAAWTSYVLKGCEVPNTDEQSVDIARGHIPRCRERLVCRADELIHSIPATNELTVTFWSRPRRVCLPLVAKVRKQEVMDFGEMSIIRPFIAGDPKGRSFNPTLITNSNASTSSSFLFRYSNAHRCELRSAYQNYVPDITSPPFWSKIVLCIGLTCQMIDSSGAEKYCATRHAKRSCRVLKGDFVGPEDARGFYFHDELYVLFNLEVQLEKTVTRKMFLARVLDGALKDTKLVETDESVSEVEKNFIPLHSDGKIFLVINFEPYTLCELWVESGRCTPVHTGSVGYMHYTNRLHGSSNFVETEHGLLTVVHFSVSMEKGRKYFHRFMLLSRAFPHAPIWESHSFRLPSSMLDHHPPDIQFPSALVRINSDQYDVYYGYNDCLSIKQRVNMSISKARLIKHITGVVRKRGQVRWESPVVESSFATVTTSIWKQPPGEVFDVNFRNVFGSASGIVSSFVQRSLRSPVGADTLPADITVRMSWPPMLHPPAEGKLILYLPWEFGVIPQQWIEPIRKNTLEIWTPSFESQTAFLRSGFPRSSVIVVPHGVPQEYCDLFDPKAAKAPGDTFNILYHGGFLYRKGVDVLLESFELAFDITANVHLTIHTEYGDDQVFKEFKRKLSVTHMRSKITYIRARLTGREVVRLLQSNHVLLHPSRAEGYGLAVAEAMSLGVLPIASRLGAHIDFVKGLGFFYDTKRTVCTKSPCSSTGDRLAAWGLTPAKPHRFFHWNEAPAREISKALRHAHSTFTNDPKSFHELRRSAHKEICKTTWDVVQDKVVNLIKSKLDIMKRNDKMQLG